MSGQLNSTVQMAISTHEDAAKGMNSVGRRDECIEVSRVDFKTF
jgi:hypothetical protein